MKVGLLGARGYVGQEIAKALDLNVDLQWVPVQRGDDWVSKLEDCDVIIHSANSGRRFFALNNPKEDYKETFTKTQEFVKTFADKKFILVSSLSCRTQPQHPYGKNRALCEQLVLSYPDNLVVRLGPMYGGSKQAGAYYDILQNNPVFVSEKSRYALTPVEYNGQKIVRLLKEKGVWEIGTSQGIELGEIAKLLQSTSTFQGEDDTQVPQNSPNDAPSILDCIEYGLNWKRGAA